SHITTFLLIIPPPPPPTLFPYTTLFRSQDPVVEEHQRERDDQGRRGRQCLHALLDDEHPHLAHPGEAPLDVARPPRVEVAHRQRSEEHTSELQSRFDLVCRLLLEKKKTK